MRDPKEQLRDILDDTELVWQAASRDAPALRPQIEALLRRLERQA